VRNDVGDRSVSGERPQPDKKMYRPPRLTEYGSVAKLTQSGNGTAPDDGSGIANMMKSCL
jgi:hypothetical protein